MKETFYFSHDYNATQDPKIMLLLSKCGLCGLGMYWIIIEVLHQQPESKITSDAFKKYVRLYCSFESKGEHLLNTIEQELINTGLLVQQDDFVFSERVLFNKKQRELLSEKRSYAGKISAEIRRKTTSVQQEATSVQQGKERKGKEKKGKEITNDAFFNDFWNSYPKHTGKLKAQQAISKVAEADIPKILEALEKQKQTEQWQKDDGKFIPHPATWLNQRRWEDEVGQAALIDPIEQDAKTMDLWPFSDKYSRKFRAEGIPEGVLQDQVNDLIYKTYRKYFEDEL